jgi:light-regulated signal transduction histidine kinase (bacteriophytochrome)
MGYVVSNVNKMNAIIEDILLYSRYGDETITFKKTDIETIVREICLSMKQEINTKNVIVNYPISNSKIYCNPGQIRQLFQNLIDNGIKYNQSPQPVITISMKEEDEAWQFSVEDNGIGIQPEFYERIFKIFQRLHNEREYSGTGIGLAICKRIIENHEGKIWVESVPGKGTSFFFTISKDILEKRKLNKLVLAENEQAGRL